MPEPLPHPNPFNASLEPIVHFAYLTCLNLESKVISAAVPRATVRGAWQLEPLISVRLLGFMLLEAPTDAGREDLAAEIVRCSNDRELQELGNAYYDHLLRCFFRSKNTDTLPKSLYEEPVIDLIVQDVEIRALSATTPTDYLTAKRNALVRDGYRCMLSQKLDLEILQQNLFLDDGSEAVTTRCAHIIFCPYEGLDGSKRTAYATSAYAIFGRYGDIVYSQELDSQMVHRLENVLTLAPDLYDSFDQLNIWLEKTPNSPDHCYTVKAPKAYDFLVRSIKTSERRVQFTTPDPERLPLPDPRYLKVHAACAKAAHLSGAADCIRTLFGNMEDATVLASDGTSHDLLHYALLRR